MERVKPQQKLPQNMIDLLKDIGENSVLFHIYTLIHHTRWQAFKNLMHAGCDIVLLDLQTNRTIKIEVKTRQLLYTTATSKNTENMLEFEMTENEFANIDVLVCYWFEHNAYFIIPKSDFNELKSVKKVRIRLNQDNTFGVSNKYLNNWKPILDML